MKNSQAYREEFLPILTGEASVDEREAFFRSLADHPEKEKKYMEAEEEWKLISDFILYDSLDGEAAWQAQKNRILAKPETPKLESSTNYLKWAATFIGIVVAAMVYFWTDRSPVEMAWFETSAGEVKEFVLDDGSKITLNENSRYSKDYSAGRRSIQLEGEAFFEVVKSNAPFVIDAAGISVKVLGTTFNVRADESFQEVVVASGTVEVSSARSGELTVLSAGDKATSDQLGNLESARAGKNEISWFDKNLRFEGEQFSAVLASLQRTYHVSFQVENEAVYDCKLTANFDNETLDDVLATLALIFDVEFERSGQRTFRVMGAGCNSE